MRILLATVFALAAASPVLADESSGEILAYDRKANVIVLTDKTVWTIPAELELPADLVQGDKVHIEFTQKGDEGITAISKIERISG